MHKLNLLPHQKVCLTIEEASEYSMIGENRLRKLIEDNDNLDWILHIGSWVRIKREPFEKWIAEQYYI